MEYRFEVSAEEREACANWHGGQFSMMYAIASTGSLSLSNALCERRTFTHSTEKWKFEELMQQFLDECYDLLNGNPSHIEELAPVNDMFVRGTHMMLGF